MKKFENFLGRQAVKFVKGGALDKKNVEHYDRAVDYVRSAIENGEIYGTLDDVIKILTDMGGFRVPWKDKKMDNRFGNKAMDIALEDFAKEILKDATATAAPLDENLKNKSKKMNHVKKFENIDNYEGTDDEYLSSPEYFIETYINGQNAQLREMLANFRAEDRMEELVEYIKEYGDNTEIIEWIAKN